MCICPVGLNGSSCESIVVENKVNAKCKITLLLYVCSSQICLNSNCVIILFYNSK